MSVTTIDSKIKSAEKQSNFLFKQKRTWQEEVDTLLDRMNTLNGLLMDFNILHTKLAIEIERDFKGFKRSHNAKEGIRKITTITSRILVMVRRSDLYPGVKTTYLQIKTENNYLRELIHDRSVALELDADEEMKAIASESIKAIKAL